MVRVQRGALVKKMVVAGAVALSLCVFGGGVSVASPLLPTEGASAQQDSTYNVDRPLVAALEQAVESNPGATVSVVGISGEGEGKLAEYGGAKSVNPAFGSAVLGLGALTNSVSESARPVVRDAKTGKQIQSGTETVEEAAVNLLSGDMDAVKSLPGAGIIDNVVSFARDRGIALTSDGNGHSSLAIARLLAAVKDVESEKVSSDILDKGGATKFIQGMRGNGGSVLKDKIRGGDVAMVVGTKDGNHVECGYFFNGDSLYSVAFIVPQADAERYATSLGNVFADALTGDVKVVEAPSERESTTDTPEDTNEERLAPPEGNSAFS